MNDMRIAGLLIDIDLDGALIDFACTLGRRCVPLRCCPHGHVGELAALLPSGPHLVTPALRDLIT